MPVPQGYTLDQSAAPSLPKGYVLDQPQQAKPAQQVQPQPTASVRATPTWGQQLSDLVHHPLNALESASQPVSRQANASIPEMVSADLANLGAGAAGVIRHPINAIGGALKTAASTVLDPLGTFKQTYDQANTNGPQFGANTLGQSLAMGAGAKALPLAAKPLEVAGNKMQDTGAAVINQTVGSLQKDFKRGADPGRAYLEAGGTPALSMDSLAGKARNLKQDVGQQLQDVYGNATNAGAKIPVSDVTSALRPPIQNARSVISGPGGTGDLGPVRQFGASFRPPIQDALNNGGFTPNDLWAMKKNVAQNTSWGDPSQIGMKSLRQQATGALGDVLTDAVPEAKPLNSQYQGLTNMANRATLRAQTGSSPLTGIARKAAFGTGGALLGLTHSPVAATMMGIGSTMLDSVPVKTTLGTALYQGGRGAVAIGSKLKGLYGP